MVCMTWMNRRGFVALVGLGGLAGAYALSPLSPLPWRLFADQGRHRAWLVSQLQQTLARMLGEQAVGASLASELTLPAEEAAEKLVAGLSRREVGELIDDVAALRAHLEDRRASDLRSSRLTRVNGWLIGETELCVAALLAGSRRS